MPWRYRGGRPYYYRHVRRDGKVCTDYVGGGAVGRLAAELDMQERKSRVQRAKVITDAIDELRAEQEFARRLFERIETLLRADLLVNGFYFRNRHTWRRRGTMKNIPAATPRDEKPQLTSQLIAEANQGIPSALTAVREFLAANPHIWRQIGDLAWHQRENLLRQISGDDPRAALLIESVRLKAEELRQSLLPEHPLPVHELAVDRVVLSHLELHYLDAQQPRMNIDNAKLAVAYQRARDAAQRRYTSALKSLATLIRLLPARIVRPKLRRPPLTSSAVLKMSEE